MIHTIWFNCFREQDMCSFIFFIMRIKPPVKSFLANLNGLTVFIVQRVCLLILSLAGKGRVTKYTISSLKSETIFNVLTHEGIMSIVSS